MSSVIRYLGRQEIDTVKWDNCVAASPDGLIYSYSFFLDHLAAHWSGLVLNDYEAVMPVVWNRKFGIRYVHTPAFIQRLGICSTTEDYSGVFLRELLRRFCFIDADFKDRLPLSPEHVRQRVNYIIRLDDDYTNTRQRYSQECNRNITKSIARGCVLTQSVPIAACIDLYRQTYGHHVGYESTVYRRLAGLAKYADQHGQLLPWGVEDGSGKLLFAALIFRDHRRLYYLLGAPTAEGRHRRATYFFIDQILKKFSGSALVFDFEGSDIPSVAAFYRKFGPETETYSHVRLNRLPWPIRLFKK